MIGIILFAPITAGIVFRVLYIILLPAGEMHDAAEVLLCMYERVSPPRDRHHCVLPVVSCWMSTGGASAKAGGGWG